VGNEGGHSGLEPVAYKTEGTNGGPSAIYYNRAGAGDPTEQSYAPLGNHKLIKY